MNLMSTTIESVVSPTEVEEITPVRTTEASLDPDGIPYTILTPLDFENLTHKLISQQLQKEHQKDPFDTIISIKRAGEFVGDIVSKRLKVDHMTIGMRRYSDISLKGVSKENLEIYEDVNEEDIEGKSVLLVDEVNHTSETLHSAIQHLKTFKGVKRIRTAVLHEKPDYLKTPADFCVGEDNRWIIYPWSLHGWKGYVPGEFFAEKFPVWMLRVNSKTGELETKNWNECIDLCLQLGFHQKELPDLENSDFANTLQQNLSNRVKSMKTNGHKDKNFQSITSTQIL